MPVPAPQNRNRFGDNPWQFRTAVAAMAVISQHGSTPSLRAFASFNWDVAPTPMGAKWRAARPAPSAAATASRLPADQPDVAWSYLREYLSTRRHDLYVELVGPRFTRPSRSPRSLVRTPTQHPPARHLLSWTRCSDYAVTGPPYLDPCFGAQVLDDVSRA